jgi:ActR/RegA family two-component response regulator
VLDLRLPGRDGFSVIPDLQAFSPRSRVVVVTGFSSVDVFDRARGLGAIECFDKLDFLWRIPGLVATYGTAA